VSFYASKSLGSGWSIDGVAGVGKIDTTNRRFINFVVDDASVDQQATGQFESDQTILSFGLGKNIGAYFDVDIAARINYIDTQIDRFAESTNSSTSGFGLALEIDSYDLKSLTSDVSLSISKPFSQKWGVLIPRANLRFIHEFEGGDDTLRGRFLVDTSSFDFVQSGLDVFQSENGATIFNVPLEKIESNYGNILVGATALFPNQFSASFSVNKTLGINDFSHMYYSLTLRKDF